jgi:glutamine synthetase
MLYTAEEVLDFLEEEDVRFVRLAFCDIFGTPRNISIPPAELKSAFESGVSFDASAVPGFTGVSRSDLFLYPDPTTLALFPWRPSNGRVVRMFCDIRHPDGTPFALDSRQILKTAEADAKAMGLRCGIGAEYEFYLFKTDENGVPTSIPMDTAGYMDMAPEDAGENVRRDICLTLEDMHIATEASHHEEGPGQNEIDFRYADPLVSADNAVTFKTVVKTAAARNGLYACFDPKPIEGAPGSGMHINFSPEMDGGDCFPAFLAGLLRHISEMTLFLNSTEQSYQRLSSRKAPQYISWSPENRSQLIRIPATTNEKKRRIELRSPDANANPYLAYALLLWAGMDGINRGMTPPPSTDFDLHTASESQLKGLRKLPTSLQAAAFEARSSAFIGKYLPEKIVEEYAKRGK